MKPRSDEGTRANMTFLNRTGKRESQGERKGRSMRLGRGERGKIP